MISICSYLSQSCEGLSWNAIRPWISTFDQRWVGETNGRV